MSRFTRFFLGKFLDVIKYACVKNLTNFMSASGGLRLLGGYMCREISPPTP